MIFLVLKDLRPGMVLTKPARNFHGVLLLDQGTELTEKNIRILKSWGVNQIWVAGRGEAEKKRAVEPEKEIKLSIQENLEKKFSDVLDDPVMMEIMRVARHRLQKRLPRKEEQNERQ